MSINKLYQDLYEFIAYFIEEKGVEQNHVFHYTASVYYCNGYKITYPNEINGCLEFYNPDKVDCQAFYFNRPDYPSLCKAVCRSGLIKELAKYYWDHDNVYIPLIVDYICENAEIEYKSYTTEKYKFFIDDQEIGEPQVFNMDNKKIEVVIVELSMPYRLFVDGEDMGNDYERIDFFKEDDKSWVECGNGCFLEYHPHNIKLKLNSPRGNEVYLWEDKEPWE